MRTDGGVTGAAWVCDVLLLPQWGNGQLQVWVYCCWPKASLKIQKCVQAPSESTVQVRGALPAFRRG